MSGWAEEKAEEAYNRMEEYENPSLDTEVNRANAQLKLMEIQARALVSIAISLTNIYDELTHERA